MKLGVFDPLFGSMPLEPMLDKLVSLGLESVEIGAGGYPGKSHCDPEKLILDDKARDAFKAAFESRGLTISALSCHGDPLHPDEAISKTFHDDWRNTVLLAEKLGLDTVVAFSGCPGGSPEDRTPNWITCAWPTHFARALEWQWSEKVIPYWQEESAFAEAHGVRIALEMHPGFVVYNPATALRLREATRANVGVNYDPSHLYWQGIDIVRSIRQMGEAIFHFHAKDTAFDPVNLPLNGVLDTTPYEKVSMRSWVFRSVGYGHGELEWRQIVSALRTVGYDGAISIEHEDSLASTEEGLRKAIGVLKNAILSEKPGAAWWTA